MESGKYHTYLTNLYGVRWEFELIFKNLSKDWKEFSLKNVNLEVKKGEYFVILGPTGAGKTLLLEIIAGFYFPDRGEVRIATQIRHFTTSGFARGI